MAVRRAKNYWSYKKYNRRKAVFTGTFRQKRRRKAMLALLMCVVTLGAVIGMVSFAKRNTARAENGSEGPGVASVKGVQQVADAMDKAANAATSTPQPPVTPQDNTLSQSQVNNTGSDNPALSQKVIFRAPKEGATKAIALTFDDGPSLKSTPRLLDALKERKQKVTFFLLGSRAGKSQEHEALIQRMANEGHEVGNHTQNHADLTTLNGEDAKQELLKANEIIKRNGGQGRLMRPPYGKYTEDVLYNNRYYGYRTILWNVDTNDWQYKTDRTRARELADHVLNNAKDGDIVLMHDIYDTSVDAAIILLDELPQQGFELMTVEELIHR